MVAKAIKEAAERELRELSGHPNKVFKLVKSMKKDRKDVEGGRRMRGSNGRWNFSLERAQGKNYEGGECVGSERESRIVEGPVEWGDRDWCDGGRGMLDEWAVSVVVPISTGKGMQ